MKTIAEYIAQDMPHIMRIVRIAGAKFHVKQREDFLQDVLVKMWMASDKYDDYLGLKGFSAWVWRIAFNQALDIFKRSTQEYVDLRFAEQVASVEQRCLSSRLELARHYRQLRFTGRYKDALVIYMVSQGYKYADISKLIGRNENAIKFLVFSIRQRLNGELNWRPRFNYAG